MPTLDLNRPRRIHLVGIGGAGMRAYASVLVAMGHTVTGSDLRDSPGLAKLRQLGVVIHIGHRRDHIGPTDAVAASTAIPTSNPEIEEAAARGIPVLSRAELLAAICRTRRTIAVSGTHGKTTTTSMLALILREGGLSPSFLVGGDVNEIGTGSAWDTGEWLVVEADESDGTFLALGAEAVVVTSVEADHLDYYGSFDAIEAAFDRFLEEAGGLRVVSRDDPVAARLGAKRSAVTFGTADDATYRIVGLDLARSHTRFDVERNGARLCRVELPLPGLHNARNAAAALAAGVELGVGAEQATHALARFGGVARRFQFRGDWNGITFVDDYAHLPNEVSSVLAAARAGGWDRVVAVFQPHRYSRTAALWPEFGPSFGDADVVVVTDVYPADEAPRPGVSGRLIVQAVEQWHAGEGRDGPELIYLPRRSELVSHLRRELRPGDLCLTLGAGDITTLADEIRDSAGNGK